MKITVPYTFTESHIPPRCRKPRDRRVEATMSLTIHEVTGAEAPVAIRQHGRDFDDNGHMRDAVTDYRWWRGKLWVLYRQQECRGGPHEVQTREQFSASGGYRDAYYHAHRSRQERRRELRAWAASVLFVDGLRHEATDEPRYVVMTFGLGGNHGLGHGTSLSTSNSYNPNIGRGRYFRVDRFEQALQATARIALDRGDTKAVPVLEKQDPDLFDVLIPEAVRLCPSKEHGAGDPFMNEVESLISGAKNPAVAGFGAMAMALRGMGAGRST